ncbi:MAG TPA: S8 family serine peptidase [Myxococcota bacterium]|nr:S8 family serine peptidase [Myxococcota bacterium]HND32429.1 S8 family serine peptidase [Myxococcota bacterium]HNH45808.1 S8 family serine peptidase [Myxococcota bacterium]
MNLGVIDGPFRAEHPDFQNRLIQTVGQSPTCRMPSSRECQHGSFVLGVLTRLVPGCTFTLSALFPEVPPGEKAPVITAAPLADALQQLLDQKVAVVNLSLGLASSALREEPALTRAFDRASQQGTLIVAASGNQGRVGQVPLFSHPWVLTVAAQDRNGRVLAGSNLGPSVGRYGLSAPGEGVLSTGAEGPPVRMTGTSVAAPFVSAAAALLLSAGQAPRDVLAALRGPAAERRSIVPPSLSLTAAAARLGLTLPIGGSES